MVQYADTAELYSPYYMYQPPLPPLQPQYVPPNSPPQYVSPTSSPLPQQYAYVAPTPPLQQQYVAPTYSDRSYRNHSESSGYSTDDVPSITPSTREQTMLHRQLKKAISAGHVRKGLATYNRLEATGKIVNVTETSALVEQLIRSDMTREAAALTMSMLRRNTHPLPKVFRFLLNKLALAGAVEEMEAIGPYLGPKVKKDVSFDNRLCNAYLGAGRGEEFLDRLVADLDEAVRVGDTAGLEAAQARFPRGGAMGLLDNHPELVDRFSGLAAQFAEVGYTAPMNVLWIYHFIRQDTETAGRIWQDYVKDSPQIMFQKVCQAARSTGDLELSAALVDQLSGASNVSAGAKGIAVSCLLDCLLLAGRHGEGREVLREALAGGVALWDVNRTALTRLKVGLEEAGETFPYEIPDKNAARNQTTSPALDWREESWPPLDWTEE